MCALHTDNLDAVDKGMVTAFALRNKPEIFATRIAGFGSASVSYPQHTAVYVPVKGVPHLMQDSAPDSSSVFV
jgi:hypothetical protein